MSHRERCMVGMFTKILQLLGLLKEPSPPVTLVPATLTPSWTPLSCGCGAHLASHQKALGCCGVPPALQHRPQVGTFNVYINTDAYSIDKGSSVKPSTGFRVRVSVPVYNEPFAPVVIECTPGSGGVQGLQWYAEKLMMDEDGDVAQEFLDEVGPQPTGAGYTRLLPSFKRKMKTRPAELKGLVCTFDGNVVQMVEPFACVK